MITIELTQGLSATIDDEDAELLQYNWYAERRDGRWYARRSGWNKETRRPYKMYLHREIARPEAGLVVDHIDGNGLNNTRNNLRAVPQLLNARNRKGPPPHNTSGFIGISLHKPNNTWRASIQFEKRKVHLGLFKNIEDAVAARREGERVYWGWHT